MVSSLSPYNTFLDLSSTSEFQDDQSPSNNESLSSNQILRTQSLHGVQLPGNSNASGNSDHANLGPVGSLEDFTKFTNGYNCTSSRFSSLETTEMSAKKLKDKTAHLAKKMDVPDQTDTESSLFNEIENALKHSINKSSLEHEDNEFKYLYCHVEMLPMEKRFGFSVSGGIDEGFPPKIDNISKGEHFLLVELRLLKVGTYSA